MKRQLQRIKDLTWQAAAIVVVAIVGFCVIMIFAPADVRGWILGPSGFVAIVAALHSEAYRAGSRSSIKPPPPDAQP